MQKFRKATDQGMKHVNITVSGLVQGVYFRASTKEQADNLGISGFVRNQADGSVYLEAEGSEQALKALLKWLEDGPAAARVEKLACVEGKLQDMNGFIISR